MAVRPLIFHPDPLLAQVSTPFERFDAALATLTQDMFETMYHAPGRGLAAVQVGVLKRVFIMDATWKEGEKTPRIFINPRIVSLGDDCNVHEEGCLSIPDTPRRISRPAEVVLQWQDLAGAHHEGSFTGFEAACVQHEFDHLEGKTILDHPEAP